MKPGFEQYDAAVSKRLAELLAEYREKLPGQFRIARVARELTDGPLVIQLDPGPATRPTNCEADISEINSRLAREFEFHPFYFGLSIALPREFLDQAARQRARLDQERDNDQNRRIRLKESDNG